MLILYVVPDLKLAHPRTVRNHLQMMVTCERAPSLSDRKTGLGRAAFHVLLEGFAVIGRGDAHRSSEVEAQRGTRAEATLLCDALHEVIRTL